MPDNSYKIYLFLNFPGISNHLKTKKKRF